MRAVITFGLKGQRFHHFFTGQRLTFETLCLINSSGSSGSIQNYLLWRSCHRCKVYVGIKRRMEVDLCEFFPALAFWSNSWTILKVSGHHPEVIARNPRDGRSKVHRQSSIIGQRSRLKSCGRNKCK